jgi:hypothetical protein
MAARESLNAGLITDHLLSGCVSDMMRDFVPGKRFAHDVALAAIAVLMESDFSPFADEYLYKLAKLDAPELNLAIRVARECLQHRVRLPKTMIKTFRIQSVPWTEDRRVREAPRASLIRYDSKHVEGVACRLSNSSSSRRTCRSTNGPIA